MEILGRCKKKLACGLSIFTLLVFAIGAQAAWLVSLSDTMSSQATSALSNHTFSFTTRTGAAEVSTLAISFASAFDTSTVDFTDMDLAVGGTDRTLAANCAGTEHLSVGVASDVVTFTVCAGDGGAILANSVVTIEIGTNATAGVAGDQQIRNPGTAGSHDITIGGTFGDRGNIAVGIESLGGLSVSGSVASSGGGGQDNNPGGGGGGPAPDRRAPSISAVQATDITGVSARITWDTDEDADSKVDYGITASYERGTETNLVRDVRHSLVLSGLSAGTTYHYRVRSADLAGNEAASPDFTFRTALADDTTAPVISDVQAIDITSTSLTIAWATNELATSAVEYGLTSAYELGTRTVATMITEHEVDLTGLLATTLYHYRVRSRDAAGNEAVSGDFTFRTLTPPDITPPVISNIAVVDITENSARVTWRTNEDATSEVRHGRTVAYERGVVTDPAPVTIHGIALTGLVSATTYHFSVRSVDRAANGTSSTDRTLTTLPDETPPTNVSDFRAVEITPGTAGLTWRNPADRDLAGVRIVRRADRLPTGPNDGTTIFDGLAERTTDPDLLASTRYRYGAYAHDTSGNFASGAVSELVTAARCGDDSCTSGEDVVSCPADCRAPELAVCGNSVCEAAESRETCPADCGVPPTARCGNGSCELGEDAERCPADCAAPTAACGNAICEIGETPESCPGDCPAAITPSICGNAICEVNESPDSCSADCRAVEVPPTTVGSGEALDLNDLHLLVASQEIELVPTGRTFDVLQGTVLWVRVDFSSFNREPSAVLFLLGESAYTLAREDDAYRTAVLTPTALGRTLITLSVLYPDGLSDRVDASIETRPWGLVEGRPSRAVVGVGGALLTLADRSGVVWNAARFGEENPFRSRPDGSFAWYAPNGSYILRVEADGYRTDSLRFTITNNIVNPRAELIALPPSLETLQDILTGKASVQEKVLSVGSFIGEVIDYGYGVVRTEVLDNPRVEQASEIAAPALAVVATASAGAAASAVGFANVMRFLFTQPVVFFTRRKRKAWGTVFNAITKIPVDLAVVRLYDATTNRLAQTRVTDRDGHYFFVAQPGTYRIEVQKVHFTFPSEYLKGVKRDPLHLDIYHGEAVVVSEHDATIAVNVPMDPKVVEQVPAIIRRKIFWERFQKVVAIASPIIALMAVIIAPTPLTIGLFALQAALYGTFQWIIRPKKPQGWGIVYEEGTRKPLASAIVRIFEPIYGKLLEMQITDARGRYSFMVGPNKYKLASEKSGYTPTATELDYSQKKGLEVIREELALKPGEEPSDEWQAEPV